MGRLGPLVIFTGTFLVWIIAKGELPKYWGFATTSAPSTATPAPGTVPTTPGMPITGAPATGALFNNPANGVEPFNLNSILANSLNGSPN
jgi:hypothetical protein